MEIAARYFSAIAPGFCRRIVFTDKLVEGVGCCAKEIITHRGVDGDQDGDNKENL